MANYSILLVDDEELIRKTIGFNLKNKGYDVEIVESGEQALELASTKAYEKMFDLVITDLMMDGIDGVEVLKGIKKIHSETMVIILTGHGDLESAMSAVKFDADDYILKPCKLHELYFTVQQCLKKLELKRKVKLYETVLPVCCVCSKIRDDDATEPGKGDWYDVTSYMSKKAKIDITHTYCPECHKKALEEMQL